VKVYKGIRVKSDKIWYSPSIVTFGDSSYPTGMSSRLLRDNWKVFEGDWWGAFLRGINDPKFTNPNEA
jgi:hypothetical protein